MKFEIGSYEILDKKVLKLKDIFVQSPYPKKDYKKVNDHHTDWISLYIEEISLDDFDYKQLVENNSLVVGNLTIDTANIEVYRNKTLPEPPYKYKPLIASLLRDMKVSIHVDTLIINQLNVTYEEKVKPSVEPGKIMFTNLVALATNISNDSSKLQKNKILNLDAQANIMAKVPTTINVKFDLLSEDDAFTMKGNLEPFSAETLNPMIEGVLPTSIKSGEVNKMLFEFNADETVANGWLDFQYEDLKVEVFDKDEQGKQSPLASMAVNTVVSNNNIPGKNSFEKGSIHFKRIKDRFIFNYWWNSLKSGLKDVILSDAAQEILQKNKK